ncbi:olfactory receptor 52D1-like [Discoglossus pictus]
MKEVRMNEIPGMRMTQVQQLMRGIEIIPRIKTTMNSFNSSILQPDYFLLMRIPGLEHHHLFISIPFCSMYIIALVGNILLIFIIAVNENIHQPMYIFIVILAVTDILLCSTTVPKTLSIFWFNSHEISFSGCLTQVFFIHSLYGVESAILLMMAYDRYSAICKPLTYTTTLTNSFIRKAVILAVSRSFCIMIPVIFLLKRLPYQRSNIIAHTYCENMAVARLATANILINMVFGLVLAIIASGTDMVMIVLSYVIIVRAVLRLPSLEARVKTFNTCVSHICVILMFYIPAFFSFIAHRVSHGHIPQRGHILLANLYVLIPPMMNPIIYGVKTKEIRQRLYSIFCTKIDRH